MRTSRVVAIGALLSVLAACSSDAPKSTTDSGSLVSVAPSSGAPGASPGRVGPSGRGGNTAPPRTPPGAGIASGDGRAKFIPHSGPGVSANEIQIGLVDQGNLSATFASFFGNDTDGPVYTDRQKGDALVKYLNDHGGIAGRKIKPVWQNYDPNNESTMEDVAQRCAVFAEDTHVFATAPFGIGWECYARNKVVAIDGISAQFHQNEYKTAGPYLYSVYAMTTDRVARMLANGLADAGFFTGAKAGLVYFAWPGWKTAVADLQAALKSRGVTLAATYEIPEYGDAATLSAANAAAANAVLKFKTEGINRVLFFDATFLGPAGFMTQAQTQGYHPRYGLHSGFGLHDSATNPQPGFGAPTEQLKGSMAIGYNPVGDIGPTRAGLSDGRALCRQIMKDAHVWNNDEPVGMCETLFFLKYALERAEEVSVAGLQKSVESIGDAYGPRTTFATHFGPDSHAGGSAYRLLKFNDGCGCYDYVGPVKPAP